MPVLSAANHSVLGSGESHPEDTMPLFDTSCWHNDVVLVGLSGGMDSVCLLHNMYGSPAHKAGRLHAVHVHHGISALSDTWAAFCQNLCAQWGIVFHVEHVSVSRQDAQGLEGAARIARYGAFRKIAQHIAARFLLLAHHKEDQAETVLLNLFRGAGVAGLAGMSPSTPLMGMPTVQVCRPLLSCDYVLIQQYAAHHHLSWCEDDSNHDIQLRRNFLRQVIFPQLRTCWPNVSHALVRTAAHCTEAAAFLDELAHRDVPDILNKTRILPIHTIRSLAEPYRRNALRAWFHQLGVRCPSAARLQEFARQITEAHFDACCRLEWHIDDVVIRYWSGRLWVDTRWVERPLPQSWIGASVFWPSLSAHIHLTPTPVWQALGPLTIRCRQSDDRMKTHPQQPTRSLKYLFQQADIPPWRRAYWPVVINVQGEILAIPGVASCVALQKYGAEIEAIF